MDVTTQFHRELASSIMRPGDCGTVTNIPFYFRFLQPQQVDGKLWANQRWSWQPPVAADQTIRIRYGTTNYLGQVGIAGEARPPLDYEVVNIPIKGDLDWNADGSFGYRPDPDYVGRDDFLFRVTNPDGVSTGRVDMVIWRGNAVPVWYLLLQ